MSKGYQEDVCKEDTRLLNFAGLLFENNDVTSCEFRLRGSLHLNNSRTYHTYEPSGLFAISSVMPSHHSDTCRRCASAQEPGCAIGLFPNENRTKDVVLQMHNKNTYFHFHRRFTSSSTTTTQMLTLMLGSQCSLK